MKKNLIFLMFYLVMLTLSTTILGVKVTFNLLDDSKVLEDRDIFVETRSDARANARAKLIKNQPMTLDIGPDGFELYSNVQGIDWLMAPKTDMIVNISNCHRNPDTTAYVCTINTCSLSGSLGNGQCVCPTNQKLVTSLASEGTQYNYCMSHINGTCSSNNDCISTNCKNGKCVQGEARFGYDCDDNSGCLTNKCVNNTCGPADLTWPCQDDNHCSSQNCLNGICVTKQQVADAQAKVNKNAQIEAKATMESQKKNTGKKTFSVGEKCMLNSDCTSNNCSIMPFEQTEAYASVQIIAQPAIGTCSTSAYKGQCVTNTDCKVPNDCLNGKCATPQEIADAQKISMLEKQLSTSRQQKPKAKTLNLQPTKTTLTKKTASLKPVKPVKPKVKVLTLKPIVKNN